MILSRLQSVPACFVDMCKYVDFNDPSLSAQLRGVKYTTQLQEILNHIHCRGTVPNLSTISEPAEICNFFKLVFILGIDMFDGTDVQSVQRQIEHLYGELNS